MFPIQYAEINQTIPKPVINRPIHHLYCDINTYNDMGHLMDKKVFRNNTKYLYNFDLIEKDINKFYEKNADRFIKSHLFRVKGLSGVGQGYKLIKKGETLLTYPNVVVHVSVSVKYE